jgi:hypothetical protein
MAPVFACFDRAEHQELQADAALLTQVESVDKGKRNAKTKKPLILANQRP